jgi:hypothetical protein
MFALGRHVLATADSAPVTNEQASATSTSAGINRSQSVMISSGDEDDDSVTSGISASLSSPALMTVSAPPAAVPTKPVISTTLPIVVTGSNQINNSFYLTQRQDLWLSIQRYRRSVALTEAILLTFTASAAHNQKQLKRLEKQEKACVLTIIRTYSTLSAIGLPILCERLNQFKSDRCGGSDADGDGIDGEIEETVDDGASTAVEGQSPSQSIIQNRLPPLPKLPTAIISGRALIASANVLRKYKESVYNRSPIPTNEDEADSMGVFVVAGGVRWVPVFAVLTQGTLSCFCDRCVSYSTWFNRRVSTYYET